MLLLLFQQATGAYAVTADAGVHALAGQDAGLVAIRVMPSDVGAYALSGQDAGLVYSGTAALEPMAPVYVPRDRRAWSAGDGPMAPVYVPRDLRAWPAGDGPAAFEATSTLLWIVPRARHTTEEDQ